MATSALTAMPSAYTSAARPVVKRSSAALHIPYTVPPRHPSLVGRSLRMPRRTRRNVQDPASLRRAHAGQHQLRELERRAYLHLEHQVVVRQRERVDGLEVGDRRVVHEHVDRAERVARPCRSTCADRRRLRGRPQPRSRAHRPPRSTRPCSRDSPAADDRPPQPFGPRPRPPRLRPRTTQRSLRRSRGSHR